MPRICPRTNTQCPYGVACNAQCGGQLDTRAAIDLAKKQTESLERIEAILREIRESLESQHQEQDNRVVYKFGAEGESK